MTEGVLLTFNILLEFPLSFSFSSNESSSDEDDYEEYESSEENSSDIENIMVSINQFPIQIIALEKCKDTFDSLLSKYCFATLIPGVN